MPIVLNKLGYEHAVELIDNGLEIITENHNWDAVKPSADAQARYLNTHNFNEYGRWFLGMNTDIKSDNKEKFVYPYGDFNVIYTSALKDIVAKAENPEIKKAAQELLDMITDE